MRAIYGASLGESHLVIIRWHTGPFVGEEVSKLRDWIESFHTAFPTRGLIVIGESSLIRGVESWVEERSKRFMEVLWYEEEGTTDEQFVKKLLELYPPYSDENDPTEEEMGTIRTPDGLEMPKSVLDEMAKMGWAAMDAGSAWGFLGGLSAPSIFSKDLRSSRPPIPMERRSDHVRIEQSVRVSEELLRSDRVSPEEAKAITIRRAKEKILRNLFENDSLWTVYEESVPSLRRGTTFHVELTILKPKE